MISGVELGAVYAGTKLTATSASGRQGMWHLGAMRCVTVALWFMAPTPGSKHRDKSARNLKYNFFCEKGQNVKKTAQTDVVSVSFHLVGSCGIVRLSNYNHVRTLKLLTPTATARCFVSFSSLS
jgi:hypothetical protein